MADQSRRYFMALAGAAALARQARGAQVANDRIRVGVIGVGGRGTYLMQMALKSPGVEVAAVCDVYQRRLDRAARAAKAKPFVHHQELLQQKDIDAVMVATPDHWHAPILIDAMRAGKDVYVEKPMTHTVEEAQQVERVARETKRIVQVGVQSTSWDRWHKIREIVASGAIGQVVAGHATYSRNAPEGDWNWDIDKDAGPEAKGEARIDWKQWIGPAKARPFDADRFFRFRKYWDYSGGIATDLHYHLVAPMHLALGNEHPVRVVGTGGLWVYNDGREVPDTFLDTGDYPDKYSLIVQSSQVNEHGPITMIRGTKATIQLGDEWEGPKSRQLDTAEIVAEAPFVKEVKARFGSDRVVLNGMGNQGDQKHVDNFFDCVRTRKQPNCPAELGSTTMTHIGLAVRSYREGKVFHFDPKSGRVIDKRS